MKRWSRPDGREIESPEIDAFLAEVVEVSRRHGFSLCHEDGHGAFLVEELCEFNFKWLMSAAANILNTERWIPWEPKEDSACPVDRTTSVFARLSDGTEVGPCWASFVSWRRADGEGRHVVAYRLAEPTKEPP